MSKIDNVTAAYLRAINAGSGDRVVDSGDVARAADGLGRQGKCDQQLDTVERGTLKQIGKNLGVDAKILTSIEALAAGASDLEIEVPDAPQKPKRLPPSFDFESIHETASGGVGARAVQFEDKDGNLLRVLEQDDGSFVLKFLKRPESLPRDAKMSEINAAFEKAAPPPMPLTEDIAAFLADKIVAMTFKETGSPAFDAYDYHQTLRNVVVQTPMAAGDATPDGIDFTQYNGSGRSYTPKDGAAEYTLMLDDAAAYIRASQTSDGYVTEIAYSRGENAAWVDETALEYRPITEGEAQGIRDAVDLNNVSGRLWTKFFGGTQLLAQVGQQLAPPIETRIRDAIEELSSGETTDGERLMDFLVNQDPELLSSMTTGFPGDRTAQDRVVLRALFEQRGASRAEAEQQTMLADKYGFGTVVSPSGTVGMWPASATPEKVTLALKENPDLQPRIQAYLGSYLEQRGGTVADVETREVELTRDGASSPWAAHYSVGYTEQELLEGPEVVAWTLNQMPGAGDINVRALPEGTVLNVPTKDFRAAVIQQVRQNPQKFAQALSTALGDMLLTAGRKPSDISFNGFVAQFPTEVFINRETGMVLFEREHFAGSSQDSVLDRPYLAENYFWANIKDRTAHQMSSTGFGGSSEEYEASFDGGLEIQRQGDTISVKNADGSTSQLTKLTGLQATFLVNSVGFEALPVVQKPEYLARLPDGRLFYVDSPKYDYSYDGFRAFIGTPGNMEEVEITDVARARDGGTTYVSTSAGVFFSPTPLQPDGQSTFTPAGSETPQVLEEIQVRGGNAADLVASLGIEAGSDDMSVPHF